MNILNSLKSHSSNTIQLENFIDNNFQDIYDFFYNQTQLELSQYKKEIQSYFQFSIQKIISLNCFNKSNTNFIILMIEVCERIDLLMNFKILYDYLYKSGYQLDSRLQAINHNISDIIRFEDYFTVIPNILDLLEKSFFEEEERKEVITYTFINFYSSIVYNFGKRKKNDILILKEKMKTDYQIRDKDFLDYSFIEIIFSINIDNFREAHNKIIDKLNNYLYQKSIIIKYINNDICKIEDGEYYQRLKQILNANFDKIRQVSVQYINSITNSDEIFNQLERGTKILDNKEELYQYIHSFGKMHKTKLYSSFDTVIYQLNNKTINVIDWGCGQALASSLLIDYIKERNLNINISDIILIEPSQIALSRGLLHIDILKEYEIDIKAVNKDIYTLKENNLILNNDNITLHLFSNILDVEFFKLDKAFLEKISNSQNGFNHFICISPNIHDKRNARLDIFYKYFNDNFETQLISNRDDDIGSYKRYEKIFKTEI